MEWIKRPTGVSERIGWNGCIAIGEGWIKPNDRYTIGPAKERIGRGDMKGLDWRTRRNWAEANEVIERTELYERSVICLSHLTVSLLTDGEEWPLTHFTFLAWADGGQLIFLFFAIAFTYYLSGQAVATGCLPDPPPSRYKHAFMFMAQIVQFSIYFHCSSVFMEIC